MYFSLSPKIVLNLSADNAPREAKTPLISIITQIQDSDSPGQAEI